MTDPAGSLAPLVDRGVLLTVAYDGSSFAGWAKQERAASIAAELDRAIATIDPAATPVRGASRTDARVHARGQLVAFETQRTIEPRGWLCALNGVLPPAIAVLRAAAVGPGFQPRRAAANKRYQYTLLCSAVRDPFWEQRAWRLGYRFNHEAMVQEASTILGTHDFAAYRSVADSRQNTVRTIRRAEVRRSGSDPRCVAIVVEGNGFLHNMVRIIVGTLVDVGRGRLAPGAFVRAFTTRCRSDLGPTAPPGGLCLERIELADEDILWWPASPPVIDWPGTVA